MVFRQKTRTYYPRGRESHAPPHLLVCLPGDRHRAHQRSDELQRELQEQHVTSSDVASPLHQHGALLR